MIDCLSQSRYKTGKNGEKVNTNLGLYVGVLWLAAILVSEPENAVHLRYNVIRVGKSTTYTHQKVPIAVFVRKGEVVKFGYVRRWGWLVGVGAGV